MEGARAVGGVRLEGGRDLEKKGWRLMIFCARATRGRRLPSLDARNRRSFSPHLEEITSELGGSIYIVRRVQWKIWETLEVRGLRVEAGPREIEARAEENQILAQP